MQLVLQDARGVGHCVFRRNRAIGLDVERELVVVQHLTGAGVFNEHANALNRREDRVDRDVAQRGIIRTVAVCGHVALAGRDRELHAELEPSSRWQMMWSGLRISMSDDVSI